MLYLIGAGLGDIKDLSVKAVEALKTCDHIYLESYTSLYQSSKEDIETYLGKEITLAPRNLVEDNPEILDKAKKGNAALLIIGDVFAATTHVELYQRARKEGIKVQVMHNASVLTAVGIVGLELYKFGKTTSIPYPSKGFFPTTPYDVYEKNREMGLHTLFLLDLRPAEDRFMTVNEAIAQLKAIEEKEKSGLITDDLLAIGCARLGVDPTIKAGTISELEKTDFGKPPHCLIIPGKLHFMEEEMLSFWR